MRTTCKVRNVIVTAGVVLALSLVSTPVHGQQPDFDAWRESFSERLDQSLSELRGPAETERKSPLVVTRGRAAETESLPTFPSAFRDSEKQNRFPTLASILREKGLPASLISVAAVESSFNPLALSPKGARGMWQFMPATARRYGLIVEPHRDERIDPVKSTVAAAEYMKDLYAQFQDWPLALAAYNAGEDRVARAIDRTGARDFWTLRQRAALPDETLEYVPAVLAKLRAPLIAPEFGSASGETDNLPRIKGPSGGQTIYASAAPVPADSK